MAKSIEELRHAELMNLRESHGGIITGDDVINFARDPKTACHSYFTWDDTRAAHEYRLIQARRLIVSVTIIPNGSDKPIQANVSLLRDRVGRENGGYRDIVSVLSDKQLRAELLAQALRDLDYWQRKYNELHELADVFEAADNVKKRQRRKRKPVGAA